MRSKGGDTLGAVKRDLFTPEKAYSYASLSDVATIKGLILNRWQLDKFYGVNVNYDYNTAGDVYDFNVELMCLYWDLDKLIEETPLTKEQQILLNNAMLGNDIDKNELDKICVKLKKTNDKKWLETIILNKIKVNWKKCSKCGEIKPAIEKYFYKNPSSKDKLRSICKECE